MTVVSDNTRFYADIRGGFLERGRQTTVRLSKTAIFCTFARYFFRSFRGLAKIIIYRYYYLVPRRLFTDSIICYSIVHGQLHETCFVLHSSISTSITTLCLKKTTLKNDTDVTHYRFNPHQPISVIFGRDVAERVCY